MEGMTNKQIEAGVRAYERRVAGLKWDLCIVLDRPDGEMHVIKTGVRFDKRKDLTPQMRRDLLRAVREVVAEAATKKGAIR